MNIIRDVTDHILQNTLFDSWHYDGHPLFCKLDEKHMDNTATFERLQRLRPWINLLAKDKKELLFLQQGLLNLHNKICFCECFDCGGVECKALLENARSRN